MNDNDTTYLPGHHGVIYGARQVAALAPKVNMIQASECIVLLGYLQLTVIGYVRIFK